MLFRSGQAFYNTSPFLLRDLKSRATQQKLKDDFEAYLDGFSPNVQDILNNFAFRNQIPKLSKADALGMLIEKFLDKDINLSPNPVGDLPTLVLDDGTVLTESLAICRHLEEIQPLPPLLGTDPRSRARVNETVDRLMFRLYVPATQAFRHTHAFWAERLTQVPAYGELAREAVRQELAWLESALTDEIGRAHV